MADSGVAVTGDVHGSLVVGDHNLTVAAAHSIVTVHAGPRPIPQRRATIEMLPRRLGVVLGRDVELAEIERAARSDRIVQLHGPSGIGKSTLVRHVAHRLAGDGAGVGDGVVFVDASGRDLTDVLQDVFECSFDAPGLKPTPIELRRHMQDVRMDLVLDELRCQPDQLTLLLDALASSTVVVSSPERSAWGYGHVLELSGLDRTASLDLVRHQLGRALEGDEATRAAELWSATGGHPLELVRVAAVAGSHGGRLPLPGEVAALVPRLLAGLPDRARELLGALAFGPDAPVHPDVLAAVTAVAEGEHDAMVADAERLVRLGLATASDAGYQLPSGTVEQVANHLDRSAGHLEQVAKRLTAWVAAPGREPAQVADHGPFITGVIAAATAANRPDLGARLARVTSPHGARSRRWGMWGLVLAGGLEAARRAGDKQTEAYLTHEDGVRSFLSGRTAAAAALLTAAAALWSQAGGAGGGGATGAAHAQALADAAATLAPTAAAPAAPTAPAATASAPAHMGAVAPAKVVAGFAALAVGAGSLFAARNVAASDPPETSAAQRPETTVADSEPVPPSSGTTAPGGGSTPGGGDTAELTMLVEAQDGREAAEASYPFVVGEGGTISGDLQFLSQEYPQYYGSAYNDLYSVTLATPQGVIVLGTGNLNSSTWGPASHGYSGTAAAASFNEDVRRFAGQAVDLRIHVANVGDTSVASAVLISNLRIDQVSPCSEATLAELHGTPSEPARLRLDGLDDQLAGLDGARFKNLVEVVATEAGVDPGLLAVNALAEQPSAPGWLSPAPVAAEHVGLGSWPETQAEITEALPEAPEISADPASGEFADGRQALRAMAWALRHADVQMSKEVGPSYGQRPANQRYTLQRVAFAQGLSAAVELGRDADASGTSVLDGSGDPDDPRRAATIRGAQAVHVAYSMFGQGVSCEP